MSHKYIYFIFNKHGQPIFFNFINNLNQLSRDIKHNEPLIKWENNFTKTLIKISKSEQKPYIKIMKARFNLDFKTVPPKSDNINIVFK
jgi:hypothetical protein